MVKIMENPIKMDDLGENPPFKETPISLEESGCLGLKGQNVFFKTKVGKGRYQIQLVKIWSTRLGIMKELHKQAIWSLEGS